MSYKLAAPTGESALCTWRFYADQPSTTSVIPDGCRDFIVAQYPDGQVRAFVSSLDTARYQVQTVGGVLMTGVRFKPGVLLNEPALQQFLVAHDPMDLFRGDRIEEYCLRPPGLTESLACLAQACLSVEQAAKECGVSIRTLQRVVRQGSGRSPGFWRALARARLAGRELHRYERLVDAAHACHYADQAHLSREMRRWFGATPTSIAQSEQLLAMLDEPGYATPVTGEQISTKNPLGSVT